MLNSKKIKRLLVISLLVVFFISGAFLFRYLQRISYIEIKNPYSSSVQVKISLPNGNNSTQDIAPGSRKVRIDSSYFTLFAKSNEGNFFVSEKSLEFMQTKQINVALDKEKSTSFIGESTDSCFFKNTSLVTYICGASISNMKQYVPSTLQSPGYLNPSKRKNQYLNILGNVYTEKGEVLLMNLSNVPEEAYEGYGEPAVTGGRPPKGYSLQIMNEGTNIAQIKELRELDPAKNYQIKAGDGGFILYGESDAYFLSSDFNKIDKIDLPVGEGQLNQIDINGDYVVLGYGPRTVDYRGKKNTSSVKLMKGKKVIFSQKYKGAVGNVSFCSKTQFCIEHSYQLEVFEIMSNKARLINTVSGVDRVYSSLLSTYIVHDSAIIKLNPLTGAGNTLVTFNPYAFSSITSSNRGLVATLRGTKKVIAIEINTSDSIGNNILKKVGELEKFSAVKNLSVSDKFIYFTPDVALTYDNTRGEMVYDSAILSQYLERIRARAREIGIPDDYQLISTIR